MALVLWRTRSRIDVFVGMAEEVRPPLVERRSGVNERRVTSDERCEARGRAAS